MPNAEINQLGRYQIVAELGRGAMGVVYKARDPQIDRMVALKTVSLLGVEPEQEQEFRERFRYEAQAAGRLHHPSIVTIFDVGEDPESREPYIVLEYVAGESLSRILSRKKKLPYIVALKLAAELADALEYAHAQGVVHRDIKPANILITEDGHAKIADFGIAKLNLAHYTIPGRILGTPAYMAPEQLAGEGVDGRSDLFSLGVILYTMVTGHSPFPGSSATTVCFKVVNREPLPASSLDLDLPPLLDSVIARAMAKEPAERYQHGAELAADLRVLIDEHKPGLTTSSWTHTSLNTGTAVRTAVTSRSAVPQKEEGLVSFGALIRTAVAKARFRDLALVGIAVLALIIFGIPPRQIVSSEKATRVAQNEVSGERPAAIAPVANTPVQVTGAGPAPAQISSVANATVTPSLRANTSAGFGSRAAKPHKPAATLDTAQSKKEEIIPSSILELVVQHQFKEATLWVWLDNNLVLTRPLHGGTQKHMVVFSGVRGTESETINVPAGNHALRVRVQTADQSVDVSKVISGTFIGGDNRTLHMLFDKHNTARLTWE